MSEADVEEKSKIPDVGDLSLSRQQLILSQKSDESLVNLFDDAASTDEAGTMSTGYFVENGLLMRKWTPLNVSLVEDCCVLNRCSYSISGRNFKVGSRQFVSRSFRHKENVSPHPATFFGLG